MSTIKRVAVSLFLLFLFAGSVYANPFLGGEETQKPAAPVVRGGGNAALVSAQISFRERIAEALGAFKDNPAPGALGALLLGAFLYGVFHAAGPGHRKTVVFSLFLAKKAAPWEPLAAGLLSAGIHGATALAVLGVLSLIQGAVASLSGVDSASLYLEGFSFLALAAVGLILTAGKIRHIAQGKGHIHGPALEDSGHGRNLYAVVALASLVPCPGATMLLMLALYMDVVLLGLLGVAAMSAGMALVVSAAAYLAYFGREGLFLRLKGGGKAMGVLSEGLELSAYLFMTFFALYTAWPFLASLLS